MCGGDKIDDEGSDHGDDEKKRYGKPTVYDKDFKGPIKNRSCTDIICCILFFIFVLGMAACSVFGYARGNPYKLLYPTDSSGRICGYDDAVKDKPSVMYFDLLSCAQMGAAVVFTGCPTPQVCVKNCTSTYYTYLETMVTNDRTKMLCKEGVNPTSVLQANIKSALIDTDDCAAYYVKNTAVIGRCIPSIFAEIVDTAATLTTSGYNLQTGTGDNVTGAALDTASEYLAIFFSAYDTMEMIFKDVVSSWHLILIVLGGGMIVTFIWIVLLRWIAGIIVWFSIFAILGLAGFASYYSYSEYYTLKNGNSTATFGISYAFQLNFAYYLQVKDTWLFFGCFTATITAIFLLILVFLCNRICIAIELIKEGSRAIGNMIFTLFFPIIPFLLEIVVIGYWAISAVYIATLGTEQYKASNATNTTDDGINYYLTRVPCTPDGTTLGSVCEFVKYGGDDYLIVMEVFMLFMFFWVLNFVIALGQIVLAGAFASYYWAFNKPKEIPAFPITMALWRACRYHLGSIAFGSLIIAIIQMIRVFLEYVDSKLKSSQNQVGKFLLKCLKCCMYCIEKFVKFLNRNAYIMIAVYGKNFCTSAKNAFFLLMRNIIRAVVLDKITDFIFFLSKVALTGAVGVGAFYGFQGSIPFFADYVPTLNYYLTPVIIVIIGMYIIASCFFSVYAMAVDTLFLCFLEDIEKHDGSPEKPYYMSKGLMKILGKKNKQLKEPADKKKKKDDDEPAEEEKTKKGKKK